MASTPMISADQMLSSAPADLFAGIDDFSPTGDDVSGGDDVPADEPAADEPADEPASDDAAPSDGDAPAPGTDDAPPAAAAGIEDDSLPEGVVKTKDEKGKFKYGLDENRYKTIYGNHQLVQQVAKTIGEPPTLDAIKLRNEAYLAQERLFSTLESGDPRAQSGAIKFMLDEMGAAHKSGAVGVDPTVPFAHSVYSTLKEYPQAFDNLRLLAARDLLADMFDTAAKANDENLYHSARRIVARMSGVGEKPADMSTEDYLGQIRQRADERGLPFPTPAELQEIATAAPRTVDPRDREIAELRAQLNKPGTGPAERFASWNKAHISEVNKAVMDDAVKPSLSSVAAGWKEFPDDYNRLVVDPLNREVTKAVKTDQDLNRMVADLQQRLRRATSDEVRNGLGAQIKNLIVHRAKLAAEDFKAPIVKFAADWLQGRSATTHERRTGAQTRTQPKGPSAPVKNSLLPTDIGLTMPGGKFDRNIAVKQAAMLLAGGR